MKMEPIEGSETSAISFVTPGNYPKENILYNHSPDIYIYIYIYYITIVQIYIYVYIPMAFRPNAAHGLLFREVSRSHTTTHHSRRTPLDD